MKELKDTSAEELVRRYDSERKYAEDSIDDVNADQPRCPRCKSPSLSQIRWGNNGNGNLAYSQCEKCHYRVWLCEIEDVLVFFPPSPKAVMDLEAVAREIARKSWVHYGTELHSRADVIAEIIAILRSHLSDPPKEESK